MLDPQVEKNRRVLVVDDNPAIHDDFRKILAPAPAAITALEATELSMFGHSDLATPHEAVTLDSAYQGQEGLARVKQACEAGQPYSLAFVDVRMPPGWDGVETARRFWEVDPDLQVVLCTAYSDYSWSEMQQKLGPQSGLLILKKPFDAVEALQLTHALTEKWWLRQQARTKLAHLESGVSARTRELAESLSLLHATLESTTDGVVAVNLAGKVVSHNAKFAAIWNFPPPLLARRDAAEWCDFISTTVPDSAEFLRRYAEIQTQPEAEAFDVITLQDGRIFERYVFPQRIEGRCVGTVVNWRDITERKQAEARLARIEELYRRAIAGAGAVPYASDYQSRSYVFMGAEIEQLIGYPAREVSGSLWQQIIQESIMLGESAGLTKAEASRHMANGTIRTWRCDMRVRTRAGQSRWISDAAVQNLDAGGRPIGSMGILQDITERKQAEIAALAFSKLGQRLSAASTMRDAFHIISEVSDELFRWDAFCIRLYDAKRDAIVSGYAVDTIGGRRVTEEQMESLPPGPLYRRVMGQGGEYIARDQSTVPTSELTPFGDESRRSAVLLFVPIRSHGRVLGVMTVQSYSPNVYRPQDLQALQTLADQCGGAFERIWAEEALRQSEAQLFQAQKLETVGKLAGGIAHEFNSIMTVLIGQSDLLLEDLPPDSALRESAREIGQAAHRAAGLTRQLLAYGRKQMLRFETLALPDVLARLAGMIRGHLGNGVAVHFFPHPGTKMVKVDAGQMEQVIINLVMNAADAMPEGGQLTFETLTTPVNQSGGPLVPELKAGEYVLLIVTDTGVGMSEADRQRAFEPFFTTKDVGKGTGLGLPTCYGIVKQSGGHITVHSALGRGTTFKIYLPAVAALVAVEPNRDGNVTNNAT
jgi:two-component system, cell cycle sensor histidine kinase and response regulator CckA